MPDKHYFISSKPPLKRMRKKRTRLGKLVVSAFCLTVIVFVARAVRSPAPDVSIGFFGTHRAEFVELRDMMLEESGVFSVGQSNVGDFWLFDGKWTSPQDRFVVYEKKDVLAATGLSAARYKSYLDLLMSVNAFRVYKRMASGHEQQVVVNMIPDSDLPADATRNFVFSLDPPKPLTKNFFAIWRPRSSGVAYTPVHDDWYVEYEWK